MGRIGRDLGITARGIERLRGQRSIVVAVNDVMGQTGVLGLFGKDFFQNRAGLLLVCISLIPGRRVGSHRQRVKNSGFAVFGIPRLELLHGLLVSQRARAVILLVEILVESLGRGDVVPLARRLRARSFGVFDGRPALFQV